MRLSRYLDRQAAIQSMLDHPMGTGEEAAKENILALIVEATEILNEINWKPWRKTNKPIDKKLIALEIADLMHFLCNILNELDISEEDFDAAWLDTCQKIEQRHNNGY